MLPGFPYRSDVLFFAVYVQHERRIHCIKQHSRRPIFLCDAGRAAGLDDNAVRCDADERGAAKDVDRTPCRRRIVTLGVWYV